MTTLYIVVDHIRYGLVPAAIDESRVEFVDLEPLCELCMQPLVEVGEVYGHPDDARGCAILCRVCDEKHEPAAEYTVKTRKPK